jgi:hypothetical protein
MGISKLRWWFFIAGGTEMRPPSFFKKKTTSATQDDPLNLSISLSGGKGNNCHTHGNGE